MNRVDRRCDPADPLRYYADLDAIRCAILPTSKLGNIARARADFEMALSVPARYSDERVVPLNVARDHLKKLDAAEAGGEK